MCHNDYMIINKICTVISDRENIPDEGEREESDQCRETEGIYFETI